MKVILPIFVLVTLACLLVDAKQKRSVVADVATNVSPTTNEVTTVNSAPKLKRSVPLSRSKRSDSSDSDSDHHSHHHRRDREIIREEVIRDRPIYVRGRFGRSRSGFF